MAETPTLTSRVPYLFRGMYEWIVDNEQTPYVVANADFEGVSIPDGYAVDNRIIFNISHLAVEDLDMSNTAITFAARFSGVAEQIYLPMRAILGIYAKESGEGMIFASEQIEAEKEDKEPPPGGGKPNLHIVK
ncbi:MAG: ClpXP protease specificity-enhancing factor [Gammaproteobacteria bacterium]|nr:ClpXP protease specificity-enhancing factor [Gammaproteobacteria bacterium]